MILSAIGLGVLAYLLGSIPTGFLIFKLVEKKDIRAYGSQSIGATNVLRTKGFSWALIVLVLDALKGAAPALLTRAFVPHLWLALALCWLAVVGHCFPFALGFRGGKGVATSVGVMLVFSWPSVAASAAVFLIIVALTRIVSLGSLIAALAFLPLIYFFERHWSLTLVASLFSLLIWLRHRANIQRLWRGQENRLGQKIGLGKASNE